MLSTFMFYICVRVITLLVPIPTITPLHMPIEGSRKIIKGLAIPWLGAESDVVVIGVADGRSEGHTNKRKQK